jgi:WH2 motif
MGPPPRIVYIISAPPPPAIAVRPSAPPPVNLLKDIHKGAKLKKTVTNDRSTPLVEGADINVRVKGWF